MSFNDLMSSGKGPGVIGMLLGLLVLVGFGSLALFVFDDDAQGGPESVQGVLKRQGKELQHLRSVLADRESEFAMKPVRIAAAKQLEDLQRSMQAGADRIQLLEQSIPGLIESVESELPKQRTQYLDEYRQDVRTRAIGVKLDELETRPGRVYRQVEIRNITANALTIRHSDGSNPIPCADLPADLYDYFQFDEQEIADANAKEADASRKRAEAQAQQDKQDQLQMARMRLEECRNRIPELRTLEKSMQSRISGLRRKMNELDGALQQEKNKSGLRNPDKFKVPLDQARQEFADANAEVARIKTESLRLRDEEKELKDLIKTLEKE
jgi:chromosome segregation ATPase